MVTDANENNRQMIARGREQLPTREYGTVRLNTDEMARPTGLVGTLAHELAHLRVLGEGRLGPFAYGNEQLADAPVVFEGRGLFLGRSCGQLRVRFLRGWITTRARRRRTFAAMASRRTRCPRRPPSPCPASDRPAALPRVASPAGPCERVSVSGQSRGGGRGPPRSRRTASRVRWR